jgi:hypothetical protein
LEFESSNQPILKEIVLEEEPSIYFREEGLDNSEEIKDRKIELLYGQNIDLKNVIVIHPKYHRYKTRFIKEKSPFFRYVQTVDTPKFRFWPFYGAQESNLELSYNRIFDSVQSNLKKIDSYFDDLRLRQLCYTEIKDQIDELWEIRPLDDNYNELIVLIIQFMKNNLPENLTKEQVNLLKVSLNKLKSREINENDVEKTFDDLIDSGMIFFPSIKGLSELYDYVIFFASKSFFRY